MLYSSGQSLSRCLDCDSGLRPGRLPGSGHCPIERPTEHPPDRTGSGADAAPVTLPYGP
ncbi:hypothetical protein [Streptomyces sp. 061-3]|uniref:hypothetical protein n=1 Tax=Streptomyces sp. 061-3 TaxID=2789268 RepID=UPI00397F6B09